MAKGELKKTIPGGAQIEQDTLLGTLLQALTLTHTQMGVVS